MNRRAPSVSLVAPLLAGSAVALCFFAGLGGWAATAPLAGAAMAPAVVVPDGSVKTVQHLEGGIVRRIMIQDGSRVVSGQALIELEDTTARSEHAALLAQSRASIAAEARLMAEQAGQDAVRFPAELAAAAGADPDLARLLKSETDRLTSRRAALADQQSVLMERITQGEAEIRGLDAQIASGHRQLELIAEEVSGVRTLLAKGLERKPRLLALERTQAQIDGGIASAEAGIARARQVIAETRQQIRSLESEHAELVARDLGETRKGRAPIDERLQATADRLNRTMITAPVTGTVVNLQVTTAGGVVTAGEPLLDIVPSGAELLLDARVAPVDIDEVHVGLAAQVHLLAYKSRNMPRIEGTVREVSADRLEDPSQSPALLPGPGGDCTGDAPGRRRAVGGDACRHRHRDLRAHAAGLSGAAADRHAAPRPARELKQGC